MRRSLVITLFALLLTAALRADLPVAPQVLEPQTAAEAWNVIRLATANVSRLLKEQRLDEVAQQVALCSGALRTLGRSAPGLEQRPLIDAQTTLAFRSVNDTAQAGTTRLQQSCEVAFGRLQAALAALRLAFPAADVNAEIHACPQHPEMLTPQAGTRCRFCSGPLRIRRIPYTDLHAVPEAAQTKLVLKGASPALQSGKPAAITFQLQTPGGARFPANGQIAYHGAPVRLLLVDQALTDFHLLTPAATGAEGDFSASYTPAKAGPYRTWAEVVPEQTAIPEHPSADLGGEFKVVDRSRHDFIEALAATVDGLHFQLTFTGRTGGFPPSRQVSVMRLHVTDGAGHPVTRLEPLMNAFAHLTGIYDDGQTILRLHPVGGDILREDLRGGPVLSFKIYPPQTGFVRLFCQVRVDGRVITAPLGVQIAK
ncbi:MAG TPA: hypothetical protein VGE39_24880 [Prosthecobacter sp.]